MLAWLQADDDPAEKLSKKDIPSAPRFSGKDDLPSSKGPAKAKQAKGIQPAGKAPKSRGKSAPLPEPEPVALKEHGAKGSGGSTGGKDRQQPPAGSKRKSAPVAPPEAHPAPEERQSKKQRTDKPAAKEESGGGRGKAGSSEKLKGPSSRAKASDSQPASDPKDAGKGDSRKRKSVQDGDGGAGAPAEPKPGQSAREESMHGRVHIALLDSRITQGHLSYAGGDAHGGCLGGGAAPTVSTRW